MDPKKKIYCEKLFFKEKFNLSSRAVSAKLCVEAHYLSILLNYSAFAERSQKTS